MARKPRARSGPVFEIQHGLVDLTEGGLFGGQADVHRRRARGLARYYVDGREVTKAEFTRTKKQHAKKKADA